MRMDMCTIHYQTLLCKHAQQANEEHFDLHAMSTSTADNGNTDTLTVLIS